MGRLTLNPDPTFKGKVEIPVAGAAPVMVEFTFKHRTRDQLEALLVEVKDLDDVELIKRVASGWGLTDDFTDDNLHALVQHYIAAPARVFEAYLQALTGAKRKN